MTVNIHIVFACLAFVTGSYVGSFLNVCIWRIPRGESIVWPPSHCPKCGARIRWHQNIPILSWFALRGRCANCRQPISVWYMALEALGGVAFLAAYLKWAIEIGKFVLRVCPLAGVVIMAGFLLPV